MKSPARALDASSYDEQWRRVDDFIHYHPGARHRRRLIYAAITQLAPRSICDVGCGNGALLSLIRDRYPQIELMGADLSPEVVRKNRERYPSMKFEVLNLEEGELQGQSELVICSEVVEHLNDRSGAFKRLLKAVTPGGHLLLTAPAGKIFETERRWGHTTHPTASEFEEHARANGCDVLEISNWGFPTYYALKALTNLNPDAAMEAFGRGGYSLSKRLICEFLFYLNYLNLPNFPWGCQLVAVFRKRA